MFWTVLEWPIYKCVQVDVYPPLSPLLINMTRENLLGTQLSFES